jgi:uncharacterized protein
MTDSVLSALAIVLILEGLLPFLMPAVWRETFRRLVALSDGQLRFIGLTSMIAGLLVLLISREN